MDRLKVEDLAPSMRLDESVHLPGGELVLYRRQAVDELLLDALAAAGVTHIALAASPAEVEALALDADRQAVPIAEISERTVFAWGLYDAAGRKVLSACKRLTTHRARVLRAEGVDVLLEPAGDAAATVARRRRFLLRRRAPRPGRGPPATMSHTIRGEPAGGGGASGEAARTTLELAMLASEAEILMKELAVGISLDVPGALEAARCAVLDTFARPFVSVAGAVGMLASGKRRDRAAATTVITVAAARAAGWHEDECLELAAGALLHEAPYSWLAEADTTRLVKEREPVRAHMLLADADGLAPEVALTVLQVQERPDGSGRPFGLTAEEILPGAKLLAVTNVFCDAVSPGRSRPAPPGPDRLPGRSRPAPPGPDRLPGRSRPAPPGPDRLPGGGEKGLCAHDAVKGCIELAGKGRLDGEVVRAFLRAVGFYPVGSSVRLSTGELARVVATSEVYERPVVSVTRTPAGLPPAERRLGMERVIDLSRLTGIQIEGPAPPDI